MTVNSFDVHAFLCTVAASANLSTNSLILTGLTLPTRYHLSNTVVQAVYSIDVALGAYKYSDSLVAYDSITHLLNNSVTSGNFTTMLHSIGSFSHDAFAARGVKALSISFDPYVFQTTAQPTSNLDGSVSSISGSSRNGNLSSNGILYIIISIVAAGGFILFVLIVWYFYRRYYRGMSPEKRKEIRRVNRNLIDNPGEVIPEHGDVVDWSSPDDEGVVRRGTNLFKHHDAMLMAI